MNWETMTDRERDALVAEKVMGWKLDKIWPHCWRDANGNRMTFEDEDCFHPSTKIECAWLVVESMENFTFDLSRDEEEGWFCNFREINTDYSGETRDAEGVARAPTAPAAICLAALRALGVEG